MRMQVWYIHPERKSIMAEPRLNPREKARLEEQKKNRKTRNRYLLIGLAILLMVVLVLFVNSRMFLDGLAAVKVGDTKYTVADVNYEYQRGYMQFTQSYGDYLSMFLDTSKPLSEQECMLDSDGGTWDDYFKKNAESALVQTTGFYKAAQEAGYTLTEEEQSQIDGVISNYESFGKMYGYTDVDGYLAANFGAGNNEKTVRRHLAQQLVIERYLNDLYESYTFTDQEKDDYYKEHADTLDRVNVSYAYLTGEDAAEKALQIVAAMEGTEEADFTAAVKEVTDTEPTATSYSLTGFDSQYGQSITREELVPGKVFTQQNDAAWYVVYIKGLENNAYNTVSVRHILIKAVDADGDGKFSDEEKQTAYDAVKAIEDEWRAGAATEESFAALANEKSEDSGSNENGGLYENIYKGQMVSEFDAFCFGDHKKGDVEIVYGESDSYTGYHLVYFVGADGELYSRILAENELRTEAYNAKAAELTDGLTAERTAMWRYVMKNN